jgi:hypothetical protein
METDNKNIDGINCIDSENTNENVNMVVSEKKLPTKIFIIPYRDRIFQKTHFTIYMKYILEDLDPDDYEIYFSHQCDKRPFNRGGTKNIGFLAVKNKYPEDYKKMTFIFNDIDTIPLVKNILNYNTTPGVVKHYYGFNFALGGIFSIRGADFERVNGFPGFWGWGMEDNTIQERILSAGMKIDRSNFFPLGCQEINQHLDRPYRMIANKDSTRMKQKIPDGLNTIRNLKYTINGEMINITSFENSIDLAKEQFYKQNMAETTDVQYDILGKMQTQNRFRMSNMIR